MNARNRILLITIISFVLVLALIALPRGSRAQQTFSADDAIAFVAGSPQFATGLEYSLGWSAVAYNTGNAYGVWRVEFDDAAGDDLGWADVSLERGRIYSYDAYFYPTDALRFEAEPILREFVYAQPQVLELVSNPADYEYWFDYDGWNNWWYFYIAVGGQNSVTALVRFDDGENELSLNNPHFLQIMFTDLPDYESWHDAGEASATAVAFAQGEIAARLRDNSGWTSSANPADGGSSSQWVVGFYVGDTMVAQAGVDIVTNVVEWYEVY
jgi:hypothetical protein